MHEELYSVFLMESAAVIILLLISTLLARGQSQAWLWWWNLAWLAYLAQMQVGYQAARRAENGLLALLGSLLLLAAQATSTTAIARLARRASWGTRLAVPVALAAGLFLILQPQAAFSRALEAAVYAILGCTAAALGYLYARSRNHAGGWLLAAALLLRAVPWRLLGHLPAARLELLDALTALFALSAALVVALEEKRESAQWSSAADLLAAAVSAKRASLDGAVAGTPNPAAADSAPEQIASEMEKEICRFSGASFCRVLRRTERAGGALAETLLKIAATRAERLPAGAVSGDGVVVLSGGSELEAARRALAGCESVPATRSLVGGLRGLALVPVTAGGQSLGVLVLGYRHPVLAAPEELRAMAEVGAQVGVALESARLLEQILRIHREWMNTVDTIRDFILVHGRDFRVERVNRALAERLGRAPAELVGRLCREILPGAGARWQDCPFCETTSSAERFDPDFRGYFLVATSRYPREDPSGVLHVVKDISDRKLAEEKYRNIFENVREGVFISRPDGRLLDCNEALARMLGYERAELLEIEIPAVYQKPEDRRRFTELMDRQGYVEDYEGRLRKKNGEDLLVLETSFATRDESGKAVRYQGFLLDVTERKRAEEELRRQNEILSQVTALTARMAESLDMQEVLRAVVEQTRRLFDFDTVAVYVVEESSLHVKRPVGVGYISPQGQQLNDFTIAPSVADALRQAADPVIPLEQLGVLPDQVRVLQQAEGLKSVNLVPLRGPHHLGCLSLANRSERRLTVMEKNHLATIGRQVNAALENAQLYQQARQAYEDLRQTQEQLLQSEKMAALGQLVSGVAHELNNPLAAIMGYSQLLSAHVSPKGAEYVEKLMRQARRTQKIIQNLLSFSRQRKPERQLLDLNRVVEEALLLRDYDMRINNVAVVCKLDEALPPILGDKLQLEQVILNIVNNACDAMLQDRTSGTLEVTSLAERGAAANRVVLEFADDGPGLMEPSRVFDPFYTTKKVGEGTGLGLSICYGIVQEHGGEIQAENRNPHGALFRIRLPAAPDELLTQFPAGSIVK